MQSLDLCFQMLANQLKGDFIFHHLHRLPYKIVLSKKMIYIIFCVNGCGLQMHDHTEAYFLKQL